MAIISNRFTLNQVADALGLRTFDDVTEDPGYRDYLWENSQIAVNEAIEFEEVDPDDFDAQDEIRFKAEDALMSDFHHKYKWAVAKAAEVVAEKLRLDVDLKEDRKRGTVLEFTPEQGWTWADVAEEVQIAIEGYGLQQWISYEEFLGGDTPRTAALSRMPGVLGFASETYAEDPSSIFYDYMR